MGTNISLEKRRKMIPNRQKRLMRIILSTITVLLVCILGVCSISSANAADHVPVDAKHFPDKIFLKYVREEIDQDHNGVLDEDELDDAFEIDVRNMGIKSLKGIEYLYEASYLNCSGNLLTELDLSKNRRIQDLYCQENQLKKLDLGKNDLMYLVCYSNQITKLNLSYCTKLLLIRCYSNNLKKLDVSNCKKLETMDCRNNKLTTLIFGTQSKLDYIGAEGNRLQTLNISGCSKIRYLLKKKPNPDHDRGRHIQYWITGVIGDTKIKIPGGGSASLFTDDTVQVDIGQDPLIKSITLNQSKATLKKGKSVQLEIDAIRPIDAELSFKWTTSNKKIAKVNQKGEVKAVGKGTCVITCTAADGGKAEAVCEILVK